MISIVNLLNMDVPDGGFKCHCSRHLHTNRFKVGPTPRPVCVFTSRTLGRTGDDIVVRWMIHMRLVHTVDG